MNKLSASSSPAGPEVFFCFSVDIHFQNFITIPRVSHSLPCNPCKTPSTLWGTEGESSEKAKQIHLIRWGLANMKWERRPSRAAPKVASRKCDSIWSPPTSTLQECALLFGCVLHAWESGGNTIAEREQR